MEIEQKIDEIIVTTCDMIPDLYKVEISLAIGATKALAELVSARAEMAKTSAWTLEPDKHEPHNL